MGMLSFHNNWKKKVTWMKLDEQGKVGWEMTKDVSKSQTKRVLWVVVMSLDFIESEAINVFFTHRSDKIRLPFQQDHSDC